MKLRRVVLCCLLGLACLTGHILASNSTTPSIQSTNLQQQIDTLAIGKASLNDILARFGEPQIYYDYDGKPYNREEIRDGEPIPSWYVMPYHNEKLIFSLFAGRLAQVQVMEPGYSYKGISVGSRVEEVFSIFGKPDEVLDINPHAVRPLGRKTILCRWNLPDGTPIKLYTTSTRTLGFYMIDDKVATIVHTTM